MFRRQNHSGGSGWKILVGVIVGAILVSDLSRVGDGRALASAERAGEAAPETRPPVSAEPSSAAASDPVLVRVPDWAGLVALHGPQMTGPWIEMVQTIAAAADVPVRIEAIPTRRLLAGLDTRPGLTLLPVSLTAPDAVETDRRARFGPDLSVVCVLRAADAGTPCLSADSLALPDGLAQIMRHEGLADAPGVTVHSELMPELLLFHRVDALVMLASDFQHQLDAHGFTADQFSVPEPVYRVVGMLHADPEAGPGATTLLSAVKTLQADGALASMFQTWRDTGDAHHAHGSAHSQGPDQDHGPDHEHGHDHGHAHGHAHRH